MTKEELEKEAEEYADTKVDDRKSYNARWELVKQAYLAGAEPREKRIAELEDKLANADYQLEGRDIKIKELEAQIEKMKCCINDLVHLGEFNEYTDEEYFNYQVHEALKNAEQFIKEIKEND